MPTMALHVKMIIFRIKLDIANSIDCYMYSHYNDDDSNDTNDWFSTRTPSRTRMA